MKRTNRILVLALLAATPWTGASAQDSCKVGLSQDPLVMRLGSDEFRIAFGLDGSRCPPGGCRGEISYKATWRGQDGVRTTEQKSVHFDIPSGAPRSLTTDRSYFDDGEARQTTEIVAVDVSKISCDNPPVAALAKH
jgi:hypothetical protein